MKAFATYLALFTVLVASLVAYGQGKSQPKNQTKKPPDKRPFPTFDQVRQIVEGHFASLKGRQPDDLISQGDIGPILDQCLRLGWKLSDQQEVVNSILADSHFLVQLARSEKGQKFLRKAGSGGMLYDRLDRLCDEKGGERMLQDLVKLPDGERFAKQKTDRAVPNLLELLPKDASGKTRKVANYDKPTGRIYTKNDLLARMEATYRKDKASVDSAPK